MVNMSGNKNNKNKLVFTCSRKIAKKNAASDFKKLHVYFLHFHAISQISRV